MMRNSSFTSYVVADKYPMREHQLYSTEEIREYIAPFLKFCQQHLELDSMPRVTLVKKLGGMGDQPTFAYYNVQENSVRVSYENRHIADVQRSLAHELVHARQNKLGQLGRNSGKTGSPQENEANSVAGEIMRMWAKKNPDLMK